MKQPTTKGFLALVIGGTLAIAMAAMYTYKDGQDKDVVPIVAPSSETVVSPPIVGVADPRLVEVLGELEKEAALVELEKELSELMEVVESLDIVEE